ncbi:hypothetical protein NX059_004717 [Plenodomus lindquistii]|nr:hypothetical protein NX059_004717 [Plenodomus lindquistii]
MHKPKISMISGPMDAKHVAGVNVMGYTGSSIDDYFTKTALEPDVLPSQDFVATGETEVLKRSDTIAHAIRRPNFSVKGSAIHTRSKTISHHPDERRSRGDGAESPRSLARADSVMDSQSVKMRPSISRLRRRVGLDKDKSSAIVIVPSAADDVKDGLVQTHYTSSHAQSPQSGDSVASSIYFTVSDHIHTNIGIATSQQTPTYQSQVPVAQRSFQEDPTTTITDTSRPPTRPGHEDSGIVVAASNTLNKPQPIPFKEIMAVQSLAERMKLYENTRNYWAYADHGLVDWTGRAAAPKQGNYHNGRVIVRQL